LGYLILLAGRPKSGKSWLVLQLAKCIDTGLSFLGRDVSKARVLYLALEDGERRVHDRVNTINWSSSNQASVLFRVANFDGQNGEPGPGLSQVRRLADNYDLIIVDTLIATLSGSANENDNALMGSIVGELARIAHETTTCLLVIHHTSKASHEDIFSTLRGASSIRGSYDVGLLLVRDPGEREAILHAESRDLEVKPMTLKQARNGAGWQLLGSQYVLEQIKAGRKTMQAMLNHPEHLDGLTVKEIAERRGVTPAAVHDQLLNLEKGGYVFRQLAAGTFQGKRPDKWYVSDEYTG
jgi:hypothetical protein